MYFFVAKIEFSKIIIFVAYRWCCWYRLAKIFFILLYIYIIRSCIFLVAIACKNGNLWSYHHLPLCICLYLTLFSTNTFEMMTAGDALHLYCFRHWRSLLSRSHIISQGADFIIFRHPSNKLSTGKYFWFQTDWWFLYVVLIPSSGTFIHSSWL